jgi:hypothetical protein
VTDQPETPSAYTVPDPGGSETATSPAAAITSVAADRPELVVGGAFAGGFVLAMILKRLAR